MGVMKKILVLLLVANLAAKAQSFPDLRYEDRTYDSNIKTVLVYPAPNRPDDPARSLYAPVVKLGDQQRPLVLEFDDLSGNYKSYRFKIKHCNADWTPSALNEIEYTYTYNDFAIEDYRGSFNTKVPYFHYSAEIPKLKVGGNYLLLVYEDKRPAKLVLSKRFMIYQPLVSVLAQVGLSSGITDQRTKQQIDFDIDYNGYEVISPQEDLKVVVRQNYRWSKTITNLKPSNVRSFDNRVEYRPFDLSNNFWAGNDFRWFDTRTARGMGVNIAEFVQEQNQTVAYLRPDGTLTKGGFVQIDDFNGQYIVENRDAANSAFEADYLNVVFSLKIPELTDAQVFVNGGFNGWQLNDANLMTYNAEKGMYEAGIFIKQGIVNYNYLIVNKNNLDEASTEGNFSAATNDYEIFVYHRPPAARADVLVGYRLVEFGRR
jgi:Domain of unknown function (DUF5103)